MSRALGFPQDEAVYGLTELVPEGKVAAARIIANPGCYPTSVQVTPAPRLQSAAPEFLAPRLTP